MTQNIVKTNIDVKGNNIGIMRVGDIDYISLTDLARYADDEEPRLPIQNWMRNKEVRNSIKRMNGTMPEVICAK